MEKTKVTCDVLRKMKMGQSMTFKLPNTNPAQSRAANCGKSIAYRLQREIGCSFKAHSDFVNNTLTLTKLPPKLPTELPSD